MTASGRVTAPGRESGLTDGSSGWPRSLLRGFLIFLLIAGIGIVAAVTTLGLAAPGVSLGGALRVGALYLGPFHHVPLVFEGDLAVDSSTLPGANISGGGSATIELGVALLTVTGPSSSVTPSSSRRSVARDTRPTTSAT